MAEQMAEWKKPFGELSSSTLKVIAWPTCLAKPTKCPQLSLD